MPAVARRRPLLRRDEHHVPERDRPSLCSRLERRGRHPHRRHHSVWAHVPKSSSDSGSRRSPTSTPSSSATAAAGSSWPRWTTRRRNVNAGVTPRVAATSAVTTHNVEAARETAQISGACRSPRRGRLGSSDFGEQTSIDRFAVDLHLGSEALDVRSSCRCEQVPHLARWLIGWVFPATRMNPPPDASRLGSKITIASARGGAVATVPVIRPSSWISAGRSRAPLPALRTG